jgi:hypothetical protein
MLTESESKTIQETVCAESKEFAHMLIEHYGSPYTALSLLLSSMLYILMVIASAHQRLDLDLGRSAAEELLKTLTLQVEKASGHKPAAQIWLGPVGATGAH